MPAVATVLLGGLAGGWIRSDRSAIRKAAGMFVAGVSAVAIGLLWAQVFPINRNLWTSSYTLFTAGLALLAMTVCFWVVDIRGYRQWAHPLVALGSNAITIYVLSELTARVLEMNGSSIIGAQSARSTAYRLFTWCFSPASASLAYAVTYLCFWVLLAEVLYRRRIRVTV